MNAAGERWLDELGVDPGGNELPLELLAVAARLRNGNGTEGRSPRLVGFVQAFLASAHEWVGGLHPLFALFLLSLAAALALRGIRRHREARRVRRT